MIQFDQVQRIYIKIILGILIALQLIVVLLGAHLDLEQYVIITVIILCFPIAYFGFQYLNFERRRVKAYVAAKESSTQHTNKEIEKLQASEEFKQYMEKKRRGQPSSSQSNSQNDGTVKQKELQKKEQIAKLIEELQQKETEIFAYD